MDRDRFSLRKALSALMGATVLLLGIPALTVSAAGIDDYPYRGTSNLLDRWGFYTGYCTSFAAFRLSQEGVVRQRSGPATWYRTVGIIAAGQRIMIVCQVRSGSVINGTGIWDRLSNGSYVTDYYTSTPAFNRFSPGLPRC